MATRRLFLQRSSWLTLGMLLGQACGKAPNKTPTILLVSGWQDVNIGDIAHTPGLLEVLSTFVPEANIILWKKRVEHKQVEPLIMSNYPNVKIVHGQVGDQYTVESMEVLEAFENSQVMIHGSGPGIVGQDNLWAWVRYTNKPFGIFGTTIANVNENLRDLLKQASFIYTRESKSLEVLKQHDITEPIVGFAPDATFFLNIHNDQLADRYLKANRLKSGQYICVIPRLRYTPYHKIRRDNNWSPEKIAQVERTNQQYKEADHVKLREAMITWIKETGNRVLVCPEMTYQVNIMDELLISPLPKDVKSSVIKRGYWLPDEAASIYRQAFAVLSFECHSPIIALANGTPAFYLRQPEDTIKGQMYYDLELPDWVFEIEQTEGQDIATALMTIWKNPQVAQQRVEQVKNEINNIYRNCCDPINSLLIT